MSIERGYGHSSSVPFVPGIGPGDGGAIPSSAPSHGREQRRPPVFGFVALGTAVLGVLVSLGFVILLPSTLDIGSPDGIARYQMTVVVSLVVEAVLGLLAVAFGVVASVRRERLRVVAGIALGMGLAQIIGVLIGLLTSALYATGVV